MKTSIIENEVHDSIIVDVELLIEPITNNDAVGLLNNLVDGRFYSSKMQHNIANYTLVKKNTPLFSIKNKSTDNKNLLPPEDESKLNIAKIYSNIDFDSNNIIVSEKEYTAKCDGFFIISDQIPQLIPIYYDNLFNIRVSEDKVSLFLDLFPPSENEILPNLEDILNEISKIGNIINIDKEVISSSLNVVAQNSTPLIDTIISMGDLPVDGKDGWLEIVAKKERQELNKKNDNIFANNDNLYLSIGKDQLIAIIHRAIEGYDGVDIFNNTIKHVKAKDINIKLTSNLYTKEDDENRILSKVDGFLEIYQNTIYVKEIHDIKGNIDVNTGNIKAYGSLMVYGNVVNDMRLNLSQNLNVNGYVGDAEIEVGKNAVIKGGFLGSGKGIIKAGGNIELKFIENQKVFTRGSLLISKEAINSELYVRDKIISDGAQFTIIGGYAIASESIELYSAGNEYSTDTTLEVGIDYQKKFYLRDNIVKLGSLKKEIEFVDKEIIEISSMRRKSQSMSERIKVLANRHTEINNEMELLKEKRNKLFSEINTPTSSKIIIKNAIYPGVKLIINGKQRLITEKLNSKTFILSKDGDIVAA